MNVRNIVAILNMVKSFSYNFVQIVRTHNCSQAIICLLNYIGNENDHTYTSRYFATAFTYHLLTNVYVTYIRSSQLRLYFRVSEYETCRSSKSCENTIKYTCRTICILILIIVGLPIGFKASFYLLIRPWRRIK